MKPRLSIIVPVFNSEKYLEECVDSILNQTFRDFEIILINDGSSDSSPDIINSYAAAYPEVIKAIHKSNGGAASARNAGLDIAQGEYIGFIDSDDIIVPEMYQELVKMITSANADVVETGFLAWESGHKLNPGYSNPMTCSGDEALCEMFDWKISTSTCTKLFKSELLQAIRFDEGHTNEDFRFLCEVFLAAKRVYVSPECFYKYRNTPESVTTKLGEHYFDIFYSLDYIKDKLPEQNAAVMRQFVKYSLTMHIMSGVRIVRARANRTFKHWLRKNRKFILQNLGKVIYGYGLSERWKAKAIIVFLRLP